MNVFGGYECHGISDGLRILTFASGKASTSLWDPCNNVGKTAVVDGLRALLTTAEEAPSEVDAYDLHASGGSAATRRLFIL